MEDNSDMISREQIQQDSSQIVQNDQRDNMKHDETEQQNNHNQQENHQQHQQPNEGQIQHQQQNQFIEEEQQQQSQNREQQNYDQQRQQCEEGQQQQHQYHNQSNQQQHHEQQQQYHEQQNNQQNQNDQEQRRSDNNDQQHQITNNEQGYTFAEQEQRQDEQKQYQQQQQRYENRQSNNEQRNQSQQEQRRQDINSNNNDNDQKEHQELISPLQQQQHLEQSQNVEQQQQQHQIDQKSQIKQQQQRQQLQHHQQQKQQNQKDQEEHNDILLTKPLEDEEQQQGQQQKHQQNQKQQPHKQQQQQQDISNNNQSLQQDNKDRNLKQQQYHQQQQQMVPFKEQKVVEQKEKQIENNEKQYNNNIGSQQIRHQPVLMNSNNSVTPIPIPVIIPVEQQTIQQPVPIEIPPYDNFQVMVLPTQGFQASSIGNMYSSAFEERRQFNRKIMIDFLEKRNAYYLNHIGVFDHIKYGLRLRIKQSIQTISSFNKYFKQQIQVYQSTIDSLKFVSNLKTKVQSQSLKVHWSAGVTQGIYRNIDDQSQIMQMMRQYKASVQNDLINPLNDACKQYENTLQAMDMKSIEKRKQFSKFEDKMVSMQKDIHKKFKSQQKHPQKVQKSYDLTQQQIVLFRELSFANMRLTKWGQSVIEWWQQQIAEQIKLLIKMKQTVNDFVTLTNKLHRITKNLRQRSLSWTQTDVKFDVQFNYEFQNIVCLTDIDFVKGSLQTYNQMKKSTPLTIQDIKIFNRIQYDQRITGKKDIIIDCLIVKQFSCRRIIPGKQQSQSVRVIATIDDNIIIVDQQDNVLRSKMKDLMNTRPEQDVVKLNYKKKGWFTDDWQSVFLQFNAADKAQEFMFFTQIDKQTKKQYVV